MIFRGSRSSLTLGTGDDPLFLELLDTDLIYRDFAYWADLLFADSDIFMKVYICL